MKSLAQQLNIYQQYHTQKKTKITHFVGVPCIVFALMIFFGWIHIAVPNLFEINLAWPLVIALLVYYFYLDILLAAGLTIILILMTLLSEFISQPVITWSGFVIFLFFLIIGVAAQWLGHYYEKKKPALMDNLSQALIAPMFLFAELMFALGYRLDLKEGINKYSK